MITRKSRMEMEFLNMLEGIEEFRKVATDAKKQVEVSTAKALKNIDKDLSYLKSRVAYFDNLLKIVENKDVQVLQKHWSDYAHENLDVLKRALEGDLKAIQAIKNRADRLERKIEELENLKKLNSKPITVK